MTLRPRSSTRIGSNSHASATARPARSCRQGYSTNEAAAAAEAVATPPGATTAARARQIGRGRIASADNDQGGTMRRFCITFIAGLAVGLTAAAIITAQIDIRQQAPLDRAVDFPTAEIDEIIAEMDAAGRVTTRLLEGGSYNVNIRRISNAETALMHPRTTDVYVVREGSGTLVTGGQIVDEQGEPVDGTRGAAIRGGSERVIGVGDVIYIPAGVPHGIRDTEGITWFNIRFDTR